MARRLGSRLGNEFPQGESFPWSWDSFAEKWGVDRLSAEVVPIEFATDEQLKELRVLLGDLTDDQVKKWKLTPIVNSELGDLPAERAAKAIDYIKDKKMEAA